MSWLDPYKWLIGLVLFALLAAGGWFVWWDHGHVEFEAGGAAQSAKDSAAGEKAQKLADAQAVSWQLALNSSVTWYDQQLADLQLHPIDVGPVRLCLDPGPGSNQMLGAGAAAGRTRGPFPGSANGPGVHGRDTQARRDAGPDIGPLLEAFARSWAQQVAHGAAIQKAYPK